VVVDGVDRIKPPDDEPLLVDRVRGTVIDRVDAGFDVDPPEVRERV